MECLILVKVVFCIMYPVSCILYHASGIWHPASQQSTINRHLIGSIALLNSPVHSCTIEYHGGIGLGVHSYQTSLSTHFHQFIEHNNFHCFLQAHTLVFHQTAHIMCCH